MHSGYSNSHIHPFAPKWTSFFCTNQVLCFRSPFTLFLFTLLPLSFRSSFTLLSLSFLCLFALLPLSFHFAFALPSLSFHSPFTSPFALLSLSSPPRVYVKKMGGCLLTPQNQSVDRHLRPTTRVGTPSREYPRSALGQFFLNQKL